MASPLDKSLRNSVLQFWPSSSNTRYKVEQVVEKLNSTLKRLQYSDLLQDSDVMEPSVYSRLGEFVLYDKRGFSSINGPELKFYKYPSSCSNSYWCSRWIREYLKFDENVSLKTIYIRVSLLLEFISLIEKEETK